MNVITCTPAERAGSSTAPVSTSAGEGTPKSGNGHKAESFVIPFSQTEISRWNRSCGLPADEAYIKDLADDIRRNGLLHPVTLVKTADGTGYRIVAGANRVAALKELRGDDSGLKQSEFKVRDDLTEDSEGCLAVSIAENHHRRQSSVYETACYVERLITGLGVDQGKLGRMLGWDRPKVNRLQKLAECFDQLPEGWRKDLNTSPTSDVPGVVITLSHWHEAAGRIDDRPLTQEVIGVLTCAHEEQWSTRQLRKALRKVLSAKPDAEAEEAAGRDAPEASTSAAPGPKSNPVELLKGAARYLREVGESLGGELAGDATELGKYADSVDAIATKLEALRKAAKQDQAEAEKAAKKAEKDRQAEARKAAKEADRKAKAESKKAAKAEKDKQAADQKAAKLEQKAAKVAAEAQQAKVLAAEKGEVPGKAA